MAIGSTAELVAVVSQHGTDPGVLRFEGRQHVIVHQLDRGDRQLFGIPAHIPRCEPRRPAGPRRQPAAASRNGTHRSVASCSAGVSIGSLRYNSIHGPPSATSPLAARR